MPRAVLLLSAIVGCSACGFFFADPEGAGGVGQGGVPAIAGSPAVGGGGAFAMAGGGGQGGAGECPGRIGDDVQWAISFTDAELLDLTYAPARQRVYFAGQGQGLPGLPRGPTMFVGSVDTKGCGLALHDLGPADGSAEVRLTHGAVVEPKVVWSRSVPNDESTKGVLCAAAANDPGESEYPACSSLATVSCETGQPSRFQEVAIAGSSPEVISFRLPVDSSIACGGGALGPGVASGSYMLLGDALISIGSNGRNMRLSRVSGTLIRMAGLCDSGGGVAGGFTCTVSGAAGAFRIDYDLSTEMFLGSTYHNLLPNSDWQALSAAGSQPLPSAHGVALVTRYQSGSYRIVDSHAEGDDVVLSTSDQIDPAPSLSSVETVGVGDEILMAGVARGPLGSFACDRPACREQAFWATAAPGATPTTAMQVYPVDGVQSAAGSWATGAIFVDGDVIFGGGYLLGAMTFGALKSKPAGSASALFIARVAKE